MDANYVTKVFDLPVCLITIYDNLNNSTIKSYVKSYIHIHFWSFTVYFEVKFKLHEESVLRITRRACPSGCPWLQATPRRSSSPATSTTACEPPSGPVGDPPPKQRLHTATNRSEARFYITAWLWPRCWGFTEILYLQLMVQNIMKEVYVRKCRKMSAVRGVKHGGEPERDGELGGDTTAPWREQI